MGIIMLLVRKDNDVFFNGKKLTIVKQASKGAGNEVVKIDGLEGSNGQKWISLSKLQQGENDFFTQAREVVATQSYRLNEEETKEVKALQAKIDAIINNAKSRYVAKPKLDDIAKIKDMTKEDKERAIAEIAKYYDLK